MSNPKIVVQSVLDSEGKTTEANIPVYPISIRRYAYLEILKSPFLYSDKEFNVSTVIPTAYVFTHTPDQLKKFSSEDAEALKQAAYDWADKELSLDDVPALIKEITSQMTKLNHAAPDDVTSDPSQKKS